MALNVLIRLLVSLKANGGWTGEGGGGGGGGGGGVGWIGRNQLVAEKVGRIGRMGLGGW